MKTCDSFLFAHFMGECPQNKKINFQYYYFHNKYSKIKY